MEWNLTRLTQQWVSGAAANNGVMLWAENEDTDGYDLRFYSSETANSADRPYLEVVWSQTAKKVYFLKDHPGLRPAGTSLCSIRATVDETGTVVGYDDYDPWGKVLAGRSLATPWSAGQGTAMNKFTRIPIKAETNCFQIGMKSSGISRINAMDITYNTLGARHYDADVGRWWIVDPLAGKIPNLSPFHYTRNNPVNRIDPDGKFDPLFFLKVQNFITEITSQTSSALNAQISVGPINTTGLGLVFKAANNVDKSLPSRENIINTLDDVSEIANNTSTLLSVGAISTVEVPVVSGALAVGATAAAAVSTAADISKAAITKDPEDVTNAGIGIIFGMSFQKSADLISNLAKQGEEKSLTKSIMDNTAKILSNVSSSASKHIIETRAKLKKKLEENK